MPDRFPNRDLRNPPRLLGQPEHGRWLIARADTRHRVERHYLGGSLVLATTFETSAGAVELVDFFRPRHGTQPAQHLESVNIG
jgi:hypothetical protein